MFVFLLILGPLAYFLALKHFNLFHTIFRMGIGTLISKEVKRANLIFSIFLLSYLSRFMWDFGYIIENQFIVFGLLDTCTSIYFTASFWYTYIIMLLLFDILPIATIFYYNQKSFTV